MTQYPKILIIGQPFNKMTGGGVTMSNLFKGWPKDRIAVVSNTNLYSSLDTSVCDTCYQLGYNGKLHPFPLSIVLPKINCGLLPVKNNSEQTAAPAAKAVTSGKYKSVYNIISALMHFFGVYNLFYKLKITPEFKKWMEEYNPDVLYTQLASLELIRFVQQLHNSTGKTVAIHIMDDWPLTINKPGIFYNYWQKRIDTEFRQLMQHSKILMSISDAMGDEYKERYGHDFMPFHNPIDISTWKPAAVKDYSNKETFTILYAGRIGYGIANSIGEIAAAVNEIAGTNKNILFEIQTPDKEALDKIVSYNGHVKYMQPIAYTALPAKFAGADVLLLPQDFDAESVKYLRFSFPTKVSEYMISGTPILVYGDKSTGITKYAISGKWAYIVTENDKVKLVNAINELYNKPALRKQLAQLAQQIAEAKEDDRTVRDNFRKSLIVN
jgi:glycosyltransferase involved in cell wall biosynthesis